MYVEIDEPTRVVVERGCYAGEVVVVEGVDKEERRGGTSWR
jgi:hypothetical protein